MNIDQSLAKRVFDLLNTLVEKTIPEEDLVLYVNKCFCVRTTVLCVQAGEKRHFNAPMSICLVSNQQLIILYKQYACTNSLVKLLNSYHVILPLNKKVRGCCRVYPNNNSRLEADSQPRHTDAGPRHPNPASPVRRPPPLDPKPHHYHCKYIAVSTTDETKLIEFLDPINLVIDYLILDWAHVYPWELTDPPYPKIAPYKGPYRNRPFLAQKLKLTIYLCGYFSFMERVLSNERG